MCQGYKTKRWPKKKGSVPSWGGLLVYEVNSVQIEQQIINIIIDYGKDQGDCKQLAEMKKDKPQSVASLRANMQKLTEERVFIANSGV